MFHCHISFAKVKTHEQFCIAEKNCATFFVVQDYNQITIATAAHLSIPAKRNFCGVFSAYSLGKV